MRIRLIGTPQECEDAVTALGLTLDVRYVARPLPARRGRIRVYVRATVPAPAEQTR